MGLTNIGSFAYIAACLLSTAYVPWFEASGEFSFLAAITKICPILYLIWYTNSFLTSAIEVSIDNKDAKVKQIWDKRRQLTSGILDGLIISTVGDVILLLRRRNDFCFMLGTVAFAGAQACYINAMGFDPMSKGLGVLLYGAAATIATFLLQGAPLLLQILLPGYGALLVTSLWRAIDSRWREDGRSEEQKQYLTLGFCAFLVSDLWIGVSTFVFPSYPVLSAQFVLLTYYVAQGLIAFSVS